MPTITISERTGADFAGIAGANLRSNAPTTNYLGGSTFEVTEYSVGDAKHQLFVITDNTGISGAVTVSGATFDIRVFDATNATHDFVLHNVTAAATASEATWNNRTTANAWTVAGGFTQGQSDATDVNIVATATALNATVGTDLSFTSAALDTLLSSLLSGAVSELRFIMVRSDAVNDFTFAEFRGTGDTSLGPILTIPYTAGGGDPTVTTVSSNNATEGSAIVHTVTLSGATSGTTNFAATLVGVNATGGGTDFTSDLGSATYNNGVTFSAGNMVVPTAVSSWTVSIPTTLDALDEANETYTLTVGGVSGTGTINDDDPLPSVSVADATQSGGTVTFVVTLSAASGRSVTVDYDTASGTQTEGVAFTNATGTLTFAPGETTKNVVVTIL